MKYDFFNKLYFTQKFHYLTPDQQYLNCGDYDLQTEEFIY